MRKILTRFRGTNFCTSSARFAPSFVRQSNGPGCTQIVRNAPKCQFWSNGVDQVRRCEKFRRNFVARTFALVRPILHRVWKATKWSQIQIVRNAPKCQFRVQWGGSGAFVAKNSTRVRGTNFCTSSARFVLSVGRQPNGPECTQIV